MEETQIAMSEDASYSDATFSFDSTGISMSIDLTSPNSSVSFDFTNA